MVAAVPHVDIKQVRVIVLFPPHAVTVPVHVGAGNSAARCSVMTGVPSTDPLRGTAYSVFGVGSNGQQSVAVLGTSDDPEDDPDSGVPDDDRDADVDGAEADDRPLELAADELRLASLDDDEDALILAELLEGADEL